MQLVEFVQFKCKSILSILDVKLICCLLRQAKLLKNIIKRVPGKVRYIRDPGIVPKVPLYLIVIKHVECFILALLTNGVGLNEKC